MEPLIIFGVILALFLNFVNGANDAAHSIATVVATRSLSPVACRTYDIAVQHAGTVYLYDCRCNHHRDCDCPSRYLNPVSIIVAMGVAISLVFVATRAGLPISSSHAMVGGLLGAGMGAGGLAAVIVPEATTFIDLGIAALGGALAAASSWVF